MRRKVDADTLVSRRELFGMLRPGGESPSAQMGTKDSPAERGTGSLRLDPARCSGCGLCARDCPNAALTFSIGSGGENCRLVFRPEDCTACGACAKSCAEKCLQVEKSAGCDAGGRPSIVLWEDAMARCSGCGQPLLPQSMICLLRQKVGVNRGSGWLDLCPSCRLSSLTLGEGRQSPSARDQHV